MHIPCRSPAESVQRAQLDGQSRTLLDSSQSRMRIFNRGAAGRGSSGNRRAAGGGSFFPTGSEMQLGTAIEVPAQDRNAVPGLQCGAEKREKISLAVDQQCYTICVCDSTAVGSGSKNTVHQVRRLSGLASRGSFFPNPCDPLSGITIALAMGRDGRAVILRTRRPLCLIH